MKTSISPSIVLIAGLSGLFGAPAIAAFGDSNSISPAAQSLSGDDSSGSALPPGNFPTSPSGPDSKTDTQKPSPSDEDASKERKQAPAQKSKKSETITPRSGS